MTGGAYANLIGIVLIQLATGESAFTQTSQPVQNIAPLSVDMRAAMTGRSWKPGCPVPLTDLAAVRVKYLGFENETLDGTLVVHALFAEDVSHIFADLYDIHFPVNKISPWENYGPGKYAEQDITVGFYCEKADDAPDQWSGHAYGIAIDINPLENPFRMPPKPWWPKVQRSSHPGMAAKAKFCRTARCFVSSRDTTGIGAASMRVKRIICTFTRGQADAQSKPRILNNFS